MIWPMPGVANSTMKCPNFGALLRAMALRPRSLIIRPPKGSQRDPCSAAFAAHPRHRLMPMFYWPPLSGGTFANQIVFDGGLVRDQRRARFVEDGKMRCLQVRFE